MNIYKSKKISDGKSYKKRVFIPFITIIATVLLGTVGMGLGIAMNGGVGSTAMEWLIMLIMFFMIIVVIASAIRISNSVYRDALFFCVDGAGNLYAVNARDCAPSNGSYWGHELYLIVKSVKVLIQTADIIDEIISNSMLEEAIQTGQIKKYGDQIVRVTHLKNGKKVKVAECRVVRDNRIVEKLKYDISNHTDELMNVLEQYVD